ncbi:MAG TPA: SET domain-containing protein, partial [Burkholderiales bacterium]|nr:SET domain-containing protein [Burkholderiales bacterium]
RSPAPRVRVQRAKAGLGLFALEGFEKGAFVLEYSGRRIATPLARTLKTRYLFELDARVTLDGSARSNLGRYVNHACRPNAESRIRRGRVEIRALRRIRPGEEITYHYGDEYFAMFLAGGRCRCAHCSSPPRSKARGAARSEKRRT